MINGLLEFFYALIGLLMLIAGLGALLDKSNKARLGTAAFWILMAIIFAFGKILPSAVVGSILLVIGVLSLFKQIQVGKLPQIDPKVALASAKRLGNWIFFPSIVLALTAILVAQFTPLGGQVGIGLASVLAIIVAVIMTRANYKTVGTDAQRMTRQVGVPGILPQLLATLGVVFNAAGVGKVISTGASSFFSVGGHLSGVVIYCAAMAIFTIIMGNAFAAFAVITAGVGIPFVIAQGGNPVVVATLGMTAGYCGTLMTPMAANFNTLPVALMDMKDPLGVIKQQAPIALLLLIIHIVLMYFLAF